MQPSGDSFQVLQGVRITALTADTGSGGPKLGRYFAERDGVSETAPIFLLCSYLSELMDF